MSEYQIVPATSAHAAELALTMRQQDRDEVWAQSALHPALALGASLGGSKQAWTGLVDGRVAVMWGVCPADEMDDSEGIVWLLGTDELVLHARKLIRMARVCLDEMHGIYPTLSNHVDERNTVAIRWLKWLGFDIFPTVPYGPFKAPFHPFRRVKN